MNVVKNSKNEAKRRIVTLDVARTIAIIAVVFCHSIESFYYMYQDRSVLWGMLSEQSKLFDLCGITFGRIGVPIFLFLTGSLILGKIRDERDCMLFYKTKFLSLLITTWIWVIIWNGFLAVYHHFGGETPVITWHSLIESMTFQKNVDTIMPAWYLPMILGVYLFLPFLSITVNKIKIRTMLLPLSIGIVTFFVCRH